MRLDIHIHLTPEIERRLRGIDTRLDLIIAYQEQIMATQADFQQKIDQLNASVARNTDAEEAALNYLRGIVQQLKEARAANDPAALDAAIAAIDANTTKAAGAIVENTPAA